MKENDCEHLGTWKFIGVVRKNYGGGIEKIYQCEKCGEGRSQYLRIIKED